MLKHTYDRHRSDIWLTDVCFTVVDVQCQSQDMSNVQWEQRPSEGSGHIFAEAAESAESSKPPKYPTLWSEAT